MSWIAGFGIGVVVGVLYGVFISWKAANEALKDYKPQRQPAFIEVKDINCDGQVVDVWLITGTMETSVNPN